MRKKIALGMFCIIMVVLSACNNISKEDENKADLQSGSKMQEVEKQQPVEDEPAEQPVYLGCEVSEDYNGFQYLQGESVATEFIRNTKTGKMEYEEVIVFLPQDHYKSKSNGQASAGRGGIYVEVKLNPTFRYGHEEIDRACTVEENLEYYINKEYDEFSSVCYYNDIEISEMITGDNFTGITVEYCEKDESVRRNQIYLFQLQEDGNLLLIITVKLEEISEETEGIAKELESFYGIEIDYSTDGLQKRLDNYLANRNEEVIQIREDFICFELPVHWKRDYTIVDYSKRAFAPNGDALEAKGYIAVAQYIVEDSLADDALKENIIREYAEAEGVVYDRMQIKECPDVGLGTALKATYTMEATDDFPESQAEAYFIADEKYVYVVKGVQNKDSVEDISAVLDMVLTSGKIKPPEEELSIPDDTVAEKPVETKDENTEAEEGNTGFQYLHKEIITTKSITNPETGELEYEAAEVYVPYDNYGRESVGEVRSGSHGVDVAVYISDGYNNTVLLDSNKTLAENVQEYVKDHYDEFYASDYRGEVWIEKPVEEEEFACNAVDYIKYTAYDDSYSINRAIYGLRQLKMGVALLVEVVLTPDEMTEETAKVIEELETFYGFEIDWNEAKLQNKLDAYVDSVDPAMKVFGTGYAKFYLPKHWKKTYDIENYKYDVYAPDGDAVSAQCYIGLKKDPLFYDEWQMSNVFEHEELEREMVDWYLFSTGLTYEDVKVEHWQGTNMGDILKVTYFLDAGDVSFKRKVTTYLMTTESYLYGISAVSGENASEDVVALAERIISEGKMKNIAN